MPTDTLRAGVIQINEGGTYVPFNINPFPVTVNGVTYQPATCGAGACDPRGIGINSLVSQLWNKYMPEPNNFNTGDAHNVEGFQGQVSLPEKTKFLVGRVDHDFGDKWRLHSAATVISALSQLTTNQIDIGGALPGDKLGVPAARAPRPQKPDFLVGGLSTTISPTLTNDFTYSYTRIWWQWATSAAPPQLPGLGGALEIGGETASALIPYNVNNQNTRQRFWDGHDSLFKDDVTWIKGNHVISVWRKLPKELRLSRAQRQRPGHQHLAGVPDRERFRHPILRRPLSRWVFRPARSAPGTSTIPRFWVSSTSRNSCSPAAAPISP